MTSLNRFFQNVFDNSQPPENSFNTISQNDLAAHMQVSQYGNFCLTDAVRPSVDLKIKPVQGYRHDVYIDEETKSRVPVIMASASKEILFDLFMKLVGKLGPVVDVVLETSHERSSTGHVDLYREHIDAPVLNSILWDYEDMLTNDGCTGIAVLNPNIPQEVQFDEHKLLIVYGSPLEQYEHLFEINGVHQNDDINFITEAEHVHSSSEYYQKRFNCLRTELGLDGTQQDRSDYDSPYDEGMI